MAHAAWHRIFWQREWHNDAISPQGKGLRDLFRGNLLSFLWEMGPWLLPRGGFSFTGTDVMSSRGPRACGSDGCIRFPENRSLHIRGPVRLYRSVFSQRKSRIESHGLT